MNQIEFHLMPPRSGKTTRALFEYITSDVKTMFISRTKELSINNCRKVNGNVNDFKTYTDAINTRGYQFVIIDDYLEFETPESFYKTITMQCPRRILIITSPVKKISKTLIDLIVDRKREKGINFSEDGPFSYKKLYFNFISDPGIRIMKDITPKSELKLIGKSKFDLLYNLKYLKK